MLVMYENGEPNHHMGLCIRGLFGETSGVSWEPSSSECWVSVKEAVEGFTSANYSVMKTWSWGRRFPRECKLLKALQTYCRLR